MDRADILKTMARKAKLSRDAQNDWAEYKLDAERKAGAILKQLKDSEEINQHRPKNGNRDEPLPPVTVLADLGVTKRQSSNWQKLASLPEEEYVEYKTETRAKGKEITEAGAVAKACHEPCVLTALARAKLSRDAQNDWAEYKLDAERKAGQILKQLELSAGGRPKTDNSAGSSQASSGFRLCDNPWAVRQAAS